MGSLAAKQVAKEVLETIGKGKKPNLGKIVRSKGYTKATAKNPKLVTSTKSYQEEVEPIVTAMIKQRDRMVKEISGRNLSKEKLRDLTDAIDKLTKNAQLLGGKDTEKGNITFSWGKE